MSLELAPETESRLREYAEAEGISISDLIDRHFPPRDTQDRVQGLLAKWQKEYGLPSRPDGKIHTPLVELFADWEAEDADMTPGQVEEDHKLWSDYKRDRSNHPVDM